MSCVPLELRDRPFLVSVLLGPGEFCGQRKVKTWSQDSTEKGSIINEQCNKNVALRACQLPLLRKTEEA